MNNEQEQQEQSPEQNELAQLWQGIETHSGPSVAELAQLAKRSKLKNQLIYIWDWLGCAVLLAVIYLAFVKQLSYLVIAWLLFTIIFSVWLTLELNKYRRAGAQALFEQTVNYQTYLVDKAKADIKVGKLLNLANWVVLASMAVLIAGDFLLPTKRFINSVEDGMFVVGWTLTCIGCCFFYAYRKIRKGKQALANLQ